MQYISINGLEFSKESIDAIKDIRKRSQMAIVLSKVFPAGAMVNIFLGNGTLKSAYNISQTDFVALAKAMVSIPAIPRKVIRDIAMMQALSHTLILEKNHNSGEEWQMAAVFNKLFLIVVFSTIFSACFSGDASSDIADSAFDISLKNFEIAEQELESVINRCNKNRKSVSSFFII